jgi:hypothetical protein
LESVWLAALVDRAQAGDGRWGYRQRLGCLAQEVSRQHVEAVQRSAGNPHEEQHQRGRPPVVAAELRPDGRRVIREQREELLQVELVQARRQGFLANEAKSERGHGIGQRQSGGQCTPATAVASLRWACGRGSLGRKPARMLGFKRKRTNLHERYDYPRLRLRRGL